MKTTATAFIQKYLFRRSLLIAALFFFGTFFSVKYAGSHINGITGQTDKSGDGQGCTCHCANSNNATSVTISTTATKFEVNQSYTFTITVSNSGEVNGGCDIACDNGSLAAGNDGLQLLGTQLTHTNPKSLPATWTFTYTAPATAGNDVIYAAGNAVNGDHLNGSGNCTDNWNFASHYNITVTAKTKAISLSATSLDFGSKRVGSSSNLTMQVNSNGPEADLTISSSPLKNGAPFSNSPTTANRVITVGSSETETITFAPTARGSFTDVLTINSDATTVADQIKTVNITGKGINGEFSGANEVAFGKVRVATSTQSTYSFTNSGDDTLFLSSPQITGSGFTVVSGPTPATLPPNASGSVVLKFSPTAKQAYTGAFTMTAQNNVTVPSIKLTGTGTAPIITSAASTVSLGSTLVGTPLTGTALITNSGDDILHVSSVALTQTGTKFSLGSTAGFNLDPSGGTLIQISYTSPDEGVDNATITVNSDDPLTPAKIISVIAQSGVPRMFVGTKDTIDFGSVRIGSPGNANLVVTNTGTYQLTVQTSHFSPAVFSSAYIPPPIAAGTNANVVLQFTPETDGPVTGMGVITSDDAHNGIDTFYMKGFGVHSALDIPSAVDFHDVSLTKTRDTVLILRNLGSAGTKIFSYKLDDSSKGFVLVDTSAHSIAAGDSIRIKIRFAPTKEISYSASVNLTTDDAAPLRKILLSGKGVNSKLSTDISVIDFGTLDSGASLTKKFTLTNNGSAPASISSIVLSGDTAFTRGDIATPLSLDPGASQDVSLTFAPVADGMFTASVKITATEGSPLTVNLQGKGKITIINNNSVKTTSDGSGLRMAITPNPTNGNATVILTLSKPVEIQLAIFDAVGKLVHKFELVRYASGDYSLPLDADKLPSGEYFLRAVAGNQVAAEAKIIIAR